MLARQWRSGLLGSQLAVMAILAVAFAVFLQQEV